MLFVSDGSVSYHNELPDSWWFTELGRPQRAITVKFEYANRDKWSWELLYSPE